jgi:NAD(P)-dependent dehydrogenase (short-subunit alcohol dehydrogenase family)
MEGEICLITGGSDGIGYVAARELARLGARVVIVGRSADKSAAAVRRIVEDTGNSSVEYLLADLSSQEEVRRLAERVKEELPRLDVLLNNAGAIFLSNRRSVDGIEMTFALNHIGYFLLTNLLLERLRESAPARIINVSSSSHGSPGRFRLADLPKPGSNRGYRAYARSKLCNILFTYELARRLAGTDITVNALHPGLVQTNIARNNGLLGRVVNFFIGARGVDANKGAETLVHLASSPEVDGVTGKFFVDCRAVPSSALSFDAGLAAELWELSERLTHLAGNQAWATRHE